MSLAPTGRALAASLLLHLPLALPLAAQADRIFVHAKVWTGDSAMPAAEAIATKGDRLLLVGTEREVRALAGRGTEVVDLGGKLVVPGFNDAHWHFMALNEADLAGAQNLKEIQRRLGAWAAAHRGASWIAGAGWTYTDWPDRVPHKKHLDAIVPDRPVILHDRDGHVGLANSKALALAGITRATPDPAGGRIIHDAAGEPTGELQEHAASLVDRLVPPPTAADYAEALETLGKRAAAFGITSLQNASQGLAPDALAVFERAAQAGTLRQRFYVAVPLQLDAPDSAFAAWTALRTKHAGPLLKFGAAKGFVDGTVDARTAAMLEPYVGGGTGLPNWTQADLDRTVARYDRAGFQVRLHAIGDRGIRMALDAYAHAAAANHTTGRRHRIEHMEVPALADLPRFRKQGVIASTQALFALPDASTLQNYAVYLGPARASHANAFKLIDDAGAVQAFGSDFSVYPMDVLLGIYVATTRMTLEGTPAGGWYPENRISVEAAVRHFTRDAAYASFDEPLKGTLTTGRLADFTVLSEDIFANPPAQLLTTKVLRTVMGGRDTWRAP